LFGDNERERGECIAMQHKQWHKQGNASNDKNNKMQWCNANNAMQMMQPNDARKEHKETMQHKDTTTEGNKAMTQRCKETLKHRNATIKRNN